MRSTTLTYRQEFPAVIDENPAYEDSAERSMSGQVMGELGKWLELNGPAIVSRPRWSRHYGGYDLTSIVKELRVEVWPLTDPYKGFDPVAGPVMLPVMREWFK